MDMIYELTAQLVLANHMGRMALTVIAAIPVALACIFLTKYIFKSAEGIDGAING